jgi:hypothetical protein
VAADVRTLVLIAAKTSRAELSDEWLDILTTIVGTAGGTLWTLARATPPGGPGPGHTHVVRLDSREALARYDAGVDAVRTSMPQPWGHAETRRDVWEQHPASPPPASDVELTALIAAEVLCTDPRRVADWDRWYDEQHLPDMMACNAFVGGTRWRRVPAREGGANDLTLYESATGSAEEAIERSAAVLPDLIAAGRKHPCHTGGLTMALDRVG